MSVTGEQLCLQDDETRQSYCRNAQGQPFFHIGDTNFDPSSGAQYSNPAEYLMTVRHQAQNIPSVMRANNIPTNTKINKNLNIFAQETSERSEYAPEASWTKWQLDRFEQARALYRDHSTKLKSIKTTSELRPKLPISPLPSWQNKEAWRYFCIGNPKKLVEDDKKPEDRKGVDRKPMDNVMDINSRREKEIVGDSRSLLKTVDKELQELKGKEEEFKLESLTRGLPPLMRIVTRLSAQDVDALLEYHIDWMDEFGFSHHQGSWIYALLVWLDSPAFPLTHSLLRELCQKCKEHRPKVNDQTLVNSLNMIIVCICKFFNQNDLLDPGC